MTFYQELQLNQIGSKAVIRGAQTKKEKSGIPAFILLKLQSQCSSAWDL